MQLKQALLIFLLAILSSNVHAQHNRQQNPDRRTAGNLDLHDHDGEYQNGNNGRLTWGRDTTKHNKQKEFPIGQTQWIVDERLGTITEAENNDTVVHNYQNYNLTEGYTGQYTILGNFGAPRLNRIYIHREAQQNFLFVQPLSYFRTGLSDFRFTNTKSPITNLAYHSLGSKELGEDRIRAYFATNINKDAGIGFKLDYLYGRGYYQSQQNSQFGGTLYGYYRGEHYNMHAYFNANHMKMAENGGIENERYIRDPQSFQQSYQTNDIPVMITNTWNKNDEQTYYLTHRYSLGFDREIEVPDSLKPTPPTDDELLKSLSDSIQQILKTDSVARAVALDTLLRNWETALVKPKEFVPVTSIIHTFDVRHLDHEYISKNNTNNTNFYTNHYYGDPRKVNDQTVALSVRNTLGLAQCEGFSKWAQMGITAYATHTLRTYTLPQLATPDSTYMQKWAENDISIGGEVSRTKGKLVDFKANAEFWLVGEYAGDFKVDGQVELDVKTKRNDSIHFDLRGLLQQQKPTFYHRHYHSQFAWWDNHNLNRELRTRIQGTLSYSRTKTALTVAFENVKDYTHFALDYTLRDGFNDFSLPANFSRNVNVRQHKGSIQVLSAMLQQNFKLGPLHWENELTYQFSSEEKVLPLPQFNAYTNLFLLFHIAKVLRVQLGGDMRYFTSYYAPSYSPVVGQFALQDATQPLIKVGNYPIVNVYANLHLKHCRIVVGVNHVNAGTGNAFWAPYYPINPLTFRFGVSWNFFN